MAWLARSDGSVLIGHGPFQQSDHQPTSGAAFYVQDFSLKKPSEWIIPDHYETITREEFSQRFQQKRSLDIEWQTIDAVPFSEVFQDIMTSIHDGVFEKTVPVVTETGVSSEPISQTAVAAMAQASPPLHSYGFINETEGFAGATPELLLSMKGNQLETMALAGTARSEDQDVFAVDEKEIREHEYVAQTLVSKLLDLGTLDRQERQILDLGTLVHFLTRIQVNMDTPLSPETLIKRLHPTPALGPLPRTDSTMQQLLSWRKKLACPDQFGSPFGVWENGRFDAVVAIRGIWWHDEKIQIPTGCGIIEASRLVNEWRELRLKREAVKQYLRLRSN